MAPFPSFYNPERIGTLFYPNVAAIAAAAEEAGLPPVTADDAQIHLVIVDMQIDFCHPQGSLFVPGAPADIRRLIEFIYTNAARLNHITCSLDSHLPHQIFHPSWWADADGNHPAPYTTITHADVQAGKWRPLRQPEYSAHYVQQLEAQAKKQLTIWPYHVLIGSLGNGLDPELYSAVLWHSLARKTQPTWLTKGAIPETEHYSMLRPEVPPPGQPQAGFKSDFLDELAQSDKIIIAGEAASHCVLETLEDLVEEFGADPATLGKVYVLRDCTSPVAHPEIDFQALTEARFAEFEAQGMQFINSADPLPF